MKKLLIDTAVGGVESYLHTRLDRDSLKELCMACPCASTAKPTPYSEPLQSSPPTHAQVASLATLASAHETIIITFAHMCIIAV